MPTYTAHRALEGDTEMYFDYVSDPSNLPAYFPRISEAHELPDGKVETTAKVDANRDGDDETVTSEANFDVDRADHSISWSAPGPHDYNGSLRLTDDGVELAIHTTSHFEGMQDALDGALEAIARNLRNADVSAGSGENDERASGSSGQPKEGGLGADGTIPPSPTGISLGVGEPSNFNAEEDPQ